MKGRITVDIEWKPEMIDAANEVSKIENVDVSDIWVKVIKLYSDVFEEEFSNNPEFTYEIKTEVISNE